MKILITGAGGTSWPQLLPIAGPEHELMALRAQLDCCDAAGVRRCIAAEKPQVIVNCAAYTKVDDAETEIDAAFAGNALAASVASAAAEYGAYLISVSTDYVFRW